MEGVRIGRLLAQAGVCSRRGAADFLRENNVEVDGVRIRDLNTYITSARPDLLINGKPILLTSSKSVYLFHKPKGYVCSHREFRGEKSIFSLLPSEMSRFFYAGRLDAESRGLVVLSNDGDLIYRLSHPSFQQKKIYLLRTGRPLSAEEMEKSMRGITAGAEKLRLDRIEQLEPAYYRVELTHGRNREIRRVMKKFNVEVKDLLRVKLGPYELRDLPEGEIRQDALRT